MDKLWRLGISSGLISSLSSFTRTEAKVCYRFSTNLLGVRTISSSKTFFFRKKKNLYPDGVPSWANYDGHQKCIGDDSPKTLIWEGYKRNYKGGKPPQRGAKVCGNPCPLCAKDIEIEYKDVSLLSQFICPYTAAILPATRTGLCRLQQRKLEAAIEEARDYGLLPIIVPRKLPEEELRTPPWNRIDIR